ncbi:hypothetical protein GCM10011571_30910 [Marinithermofilum abyssi]|jgi:glucan phosphoethanolaminetransferase (alkaline phosphatase superfamily)|uniref:Uncharacterized protein n=1 Tax=Marinithermofilum abyssi TaxID=1571185 RepID=A0A8J2YDM1_9BACL|nr:hypothetical protein [Marinithermofilum abyssi]GGE26514.1 hypothetical protein GCM10011571_30910 [Marinithermofilum abyssi]
MQILYAAIVLFFLVMGGYYLQAEPPYAVHNFVIALYFFVILFEFRGNPFPRRVYLLLSFLLLGNALMQFFYVQNNVIFGLVSLLFAYFALQARRRIRRG